MHNNARARRKRHTWGRSVLSSAARTQAGHHTHRPIRCKRMKPSTFLDTKKSDPKRGRSEIRDTVFKPPTTMHGAHNHSVVIFLSQD